MSSVHAEENTKVIIPHAFFRKNALKGHSHEKKFVRLSLYFIVLVPN
jgi:hypothetical protein